MFALTPYWKAATAFVAIAGTNVAAVAADPDVQAVLPQGWTGWLTAAATTIGGTWLVWLKSNQHTVESVDEAMSKLPVEDVRKLVNKHS